MSNYDLNRTVWDTLLQSTSESVADICGEAVDQVIRMAAYTKSLDNITGVLVAFPNFSKYETGARVRYQNNGTLTEQDLDNDAAVKVGELLPKPEGTGGNRTPVTGMSLGGGTGGTHSR